MVVINDLGFAAYIKAIKGKPLVKPPYVDENGLFCFEFDLTEKEKETFLMEYLHSTYSVFDREVKSLKRAIDLVKRG